MISPRRQLVALLLALLLPTGCKEFRRAQIVPDGGAGSGGGAGAGGGATTGASYATIAVGRRHTCGIKPQGTLWCWGENTDGQLGDGGKQSRGTPAQVGADSDWKLVFAGGAASCAIKLGGTLWCWGAGRGYTPVQVGTGADWETLSLDSSFACGLRAGGLWCWGINNSGRLGTGRQDNEDEPVQIGSARWTAVTLGRTHGCGVQGDGSLWCWGDNYFGQLGDGGQVRDRAAPGRVGDGADWTAVVAGMDSTCGLRGDGLWCWGNSDFCPAGVCPYAPAALPGGAGSWRSLGTVTGYEDRCAIERSGALSCFGWNRFGGVGDATMQPRTMPVPIGDARDWQAVGSGAGHTCGVRGGAAYCWGRNDLGQLGLGTLGRRAEPAAVTGRWASHGVGIAHACAVSTTGTLSCWGSNSDGQLGDGTILPRDRPTQVGTATDWKAVTTGGAHTLALRMDGSLWAFGANQLGQLGDGTSGPTAAKRAPVQIGSAKWRAVSAQRDNSCGVRDDDGSLWCWGRYFDNSTPGQLGAESKWKDLSAGTAAIWNTSPVAIRDDGTLWQAFEMKQLTNLPGWEAVVLADQHWCGLRNGGELWCWGSNFNGRLGVATPMEDSPTPVQVMPGSKWLSLAIGSELSCAVRADLSLWCWGSNAEGQLGAGLDVPVQRVPRMIATGMRWVSASIESACAITGDGAMSCWGSDASGQLGQGTGPRITPTPVSL